MARRSGEAPAYLLLGDEVFFRDRFREQILAAIPLEAREYSVVSADLRVTPLDEILDQARTPSLLAGRQVFFIRNVKELYGRTARSHDFPANLERYLAGAPSLATLVFLADHLTLPADPAQISFEDRSRLERIEATLGRLCEVVRCARVDAATAADLIADLARQRQWPVEPEAAQLLAELVDADLGIAAMELGKLAAYAGFGSPGATAAAPGVITAAMVTELVAGQRQSSALDLLRQIARGQRASALRCLAAIWDAEGDAAAIPLVFQLSRFYKMALVAREARARDRRSLYAALPTGLKPPGFAADLVLALAHGLSLGQLTAGIARFQRIDVALRSSPVNTRWLLEEAVAFEQAPESKRLGG